jgi:hypothetical protein
VDVGICARGSKELAVDRTFALPLPRIPSLPRWVRRSRRVRKLRLSRRRSLLLVPTLITLLLAGGYVVYVRETRRAQLVHSVRHLSPMATVLATAPPTLAGWIARVYEGSEGLTVAMRGGLLIYFGDDSRPHAKWLSAARVLASPTSAGASYLDVRLPERPAAGFPAGTQPPDASTGTSATGEALPADPTSHSLAETLEAAIGSGVAPSTGASTAAESASSAATSTPAAAGSSGADPASGSGTGESAAAPAEAPAPATAAPTSTDGAATANGAATAGDETPVESQAAPTTQTPPGG